MVSFRGRRGDERRCDKRKYGEGGSAKGKVPHGVFDGVAASNVREFDVERLSGPLRLPSRSPRASEGWFFSRRD
jgi:hypothetical protein